jgi:hypothetical protein
MKTIDALFILVMISIILYSYLKPGQQLPPPSYDIHGRMEYKPTPTLYLGIGVLFIYLILKQH